MIGGPSVILGSRLVDASKGTPLSHDNPTPVKQIFGYDMNAMYLNVAADHELPCGPAYIRTPPYFKPVREKGGRNQYSTISQEWLAYEQSINDDTIQHGANELCILGRRVDGYCEAQNTIYEYLGCHYKVTVLQ